MLPQSDLVQLHGHHSQHGRSLLGSSCRSDRAAVVLLARAFDRRQASDSRSHDSGQPPPVLHSAAHCRCHDRSQAFEAFSSQVMDP